MHPEIDRYAHLDSLLHRWDPRWKICSLAALLLAFAVGPRLASGRPPADREAAHALACLGTALALVELSRIPLGFALRRLLPASLFLLTFLIVYPLTAPGNGPRLGPLTFSTTGFLSAGIVTLRALAMILLTFPMLGTSRFDVTMKALASLRVPAPFVQLAAFSYRYVYVYADELRRMRTAMRARGFRNRLGLHALRTAGNMVGMLLVRSVERTGKIQAAMSARGYSGAFRTFDDFLTRPGDVAKAAAAVCVALLLVLLRFAP